MAQRKALVRYIPTNFDPNMLIVGRKPQPQLRKLNKNVKPQSIVRMMLPMSLRCDSCGHYLYIGTKYNMRMEIVFNQNYLGIKIYRFYFKCSYCYSEISFKTDPKNHDYVVEAGGTRNYDPIRDAQQADKMLRQRRQQDAIQDPMMHLQHKQYDSKRQMQMMQALDQIKQLNKRNAFLNSQDLLKMMLINEKKEQEPVLDDEDIYFEFEKAKMEKGQIKEKEADVIFARQQMTEVKRKQFLKPVIKKKVKIQ